MILRVPRRRNRLESLLALATLCWLVCTWPTGVAGGKHRGKSVESSALARPGTRSDSNEATASESGGGSPRSGHGVVRSIHVAEPGDASTSSSPHALLSSSTADRSWHGQLQLGPDGRPRTDHERTEIVLATAKSRVGDDVERQRRWLRRKHFLRQEYPEAYDRATKTLKHLGLPPRNDRGLYHRFSEQQYLKALDVMAEAEKLNHGDLFLASRFGFPSRGARQSQHTVVTSSGSYRPGCYGTSDVCSVVPATSARPSGADALSHHDVAWRRSLFPHTPLVRGRGSGAQRGPGCAVGRVSQSEAARYLSLVLPTYSPEAPFLILLVPPSS